VTGRLSDAFFEAMYAESSDPWRLADRWYEQRKYAITMAMLPAPRYRHAFEPGCSIGVFTEQLTARCDHVTATDVAATALEAADARLLACGRRDTVTLARSSLDSPWPQGHFDLVVLSEVGYYLSAETLRAVLDRECPRLASGATVIAAHWRHRVAEYPLSGDHANDIVAATRGLHHLAGYRDEGMVIDVFDTAAAMSVAARTGVPGARQR
jgi:predicted TPR repeat methyltransferase